MALVPLTTRPAGSRLPPSSATASGSFATQCRPESPARPTPPTRSRGACFVIRQSFSSALLHRPDSLPETQDASPAKFRSSRFPYSRLLRARRRRLDGSQAVFPMPRKYSGLGVDGDRQRSCPSVGPRPLEKPELRSCFSVPDVNRPPRSDRLKDKKFEGLAARPPDRVAA